jgi:hypothetical protein
MKDKHPIDELFARGLRDAGAEPPPQVWEGIVRERDWAHLVLLRLRRRWGWLALVLLLGGIGAYGGLATRKPAPPDMTASISPSIGHDTAPMQQAPSPVALQTALRESATNRTAPVEAEESPARHGRSNLRNNAPASTGTSAAPPATATTQDSLGESRQPRTGTASATGTSIHRTRPGQGPDAPASMRLAENPSTPASIPGSTAMLPAPQAILNANPLAAETFPARMSLLYPATALAELPGLRSGTLPPPGQPRHSWWLAATAGIYGETRSWRGANADLNRALQQAETPHHSTFLGVMAGREGPTGWGYSAGVEYGTIRYNYGHLDQYRSLSDSIIQQVVTFNSQVIYSFSDTLTTESQVSRRMVAVNRYVLVRVPVELGWHRAWRRWQFGARAGVALEFSTQRAGLTLMDAAGGTRSVDFTAGERRSALVACGTLGADAGFAFTDRLALWATPGYTLGLLSLWPTDGTPYAVPTRLGVRFRLAYTIRPSR